MIDILIVDDETKAREVIGEMIRLYCTDSDIALREADGVQSGVAAIQHKTPDLLLLDIRLKDGNGFDLLNRIKHLAIPVIFITAYEEYAIKACKVSALNYLLKPVDPFELKDAIANAGKRIEREKLVERLDTFMQNFSGSERQVKRITLKTAESIYIINTSDIVFCEADGNYTTFYLLDKRRVTVSRPLGDYEEMIGSDRFIRTHQSYLVNMDHIIRYEKGEGTIITVTEDKVPVSTRKKEQLLQFLNSF